MHNISFAPHIAANADNTLMQTINELQANWVWAPDWVDSSRSNTAGRIVKFTREFALPSRANQALLHFSADTRYKLYVNGVRVAVGPARSSPSIWYYDTLDLAPHLSHGNNQISFVVLRYFAASRGAMPFARTSIPGLTVVGSVEAGTTVVELSSREGWQAQVDDSILFPMGLIDDVFLHVSSRNSRTFLQLVMAYICLDRSANALPRHLQPRPSRPWCTASRR